MKALYCPRYGDYKVLQVVERAIPIISDDELLIKVKYSALTAADSLMSRGKPFFGRLFLGLKKPGSGLMGTGFSGEVISTGKNVSEYKIGDYIFGETGLNFSANAEYLKINKNAVIQKTTNSHNLKELSCYCDGPLTSYNFLTEVAKVKRNQSILIIGASGSLGSAAVKIAQIKGLKISTLTSTHNLEAMKALGVQKAYSYQEIKIKEIPDNFDIIYDAIGSTHLKETKKILTTEGIYLTPVLSVSTLFSMFITNRFKKQKAYFSATGMLLTGKLKMMLQEVHDLFEDRNVTVQIEKEFNIENAMQGHKHIQSGRKKGNIIISFDGEK